MRKIRHKDLGKGNKCPHCSKVMERRGHLETDTKHLLKSYYFKEWDYCRPCRHVQHYDMFKVWNNTPKAKKNRRIINNFEEEQRQNDFLQGI